MAGIGFELRKIMQGKNFFRLLSAYVYAGAVSSGPWLLSIFGILILCSFVKLKGMPYLEVSQFQSVVVYLISGSLILSSFLQQSYARYVADRCFTKNYELVVPNLNGVLLILILVSALISAVLVEFFFQSQSIQLKITLCATFIILTIIWVLTSVLSGLKAYKTILLAFFITYTIILSSGFELRHYGILGLLTSFIGGHFILLVALFYSIYRSYPSESLIKFDFFRGGNSTLIILAFTGFFYTIGVWVDKYIFWYLPNTGTPIFGPLHYSLVYDVPIFFAYLCTVPAMTGFLLRIETEYMDAYQNLYKQICEGGTFLEISDAQHNLLTTTRSILFSIIKTQALIQIIVLTIGELAFKWLAIPSFYLPIFYIVVFGVGLNVIFWATLDIFFYLDKLSHALLLTIFFTVSNALFTFYSIHLGIFYFGYGIVVSLLLTVVLSFIVLNYDLKHLVFETFMGEPK